MEIHDEAEDGEVPRAEGDTGARQEEEAGQEEEADHQWEGGSLRGGHRAEETQEHHRVAEVTAAHPGEEDMEGLQEEVDRPEEEVLARTIQRTGLGVHKGPTGMTSHRNGSLAPWTCNSRCWHGWWRCRRTSTCAPPPQ